MKKLTAALMSAALIILLSGCGAEPQSTVVPDSHSGSQGTVLTDPSSAEVSADVETDGSDNTAATQVETRNVNGIRRGDLFEFRIDCSLFTYVYAYDDVFGSVNDWVESSYNTDGWYLRDHDLWSSNGLCYVRGAASLTFREIIIRMDGALNAVLINSGESQGADIYKSFTVSYRGHDHIYYYDNDRMTFDNWLNSMSNTDAWHYDEASDEIVCEKLGCAINSVFLAKTMDDISIYFDHIEAHEYVVEAEDIPAPDAGSHSGSEAGSQPTGQSTGSSTGSDKNSTVNDKSQYLDAEDLEMLQDDSDEPEISEDPDDVLDNTDDSDSEEQPEDGSSQSTDLDEEEQDSSQDTGADSEGAEETSDYEDFMEDDADEGEVEPDWNADLNKIGWEWSDYAMKFVYDGRYPEGYPYYIVGYPRALERLENHLIADVSAYFDVDRTYVAGSDVLVQMDSTIAFTVTDDMRIFRRAIGEDGELEQYTEYDDMMDEILGTDSEDKVTMYLYVNTLGKVFKIWYSVD